MDSFMEAISLIGTLAFFIPVIIYIAWRYSLRNGILILLPVLLSDLLNNMLKIIFQHPRPDPSFLTWADIAIRNMPSSFSFPSGHAQGAMVFFGAVMLTFKSLPLRAACVTLIILISFSRMYLGVHFPGDILAGITIGFFILLPLMIYLRHNQRV